MKTFTSPDGNLSGHIVGRSLNSPQVCAIARFLPLVQCTNWTTEFGRPFLGRRRWKPSKGGGGLEVEGCRAYIINGCIRGWDPAAQSIAFAYILSLLSLVLFIIILCSLHPQGFTTCGFWRDYASLKQPCV